MKSLEHPNVIEVRKVRPDLLLQYNNYFTSAMANHITRQIKRFEKKYEYDLSEFIIDDYRLCKTLFYFGLEMGLENAALSGNIEGKKRLTEEKKHLNNIIEHINQAELTFQTLSPTLKEALNITAKFNSPECTFKALKSEFTEALNHVNSMNIKSTYREILGHIVFTLIYNRPIQTLNKYEFKFIVELLAICINSIKIIHAIHINSLSDIKNGLKKSAEQVWRKIEETGYSRVE